MRKWVLLVALLAVALEASGQVSRMRLRSPGVVASGLALLSQSDIESGYAGAFRVSDPPVSWGDSVSAFYGKAFAVKYETDDSNLLHLYAFGYGTPYDAMTCSNCARWTLYTARVPTLSTPGTPTNLSSYNATSSTGAKSFPQGGYRDTRLVYYMGSTTPLEAYLSGDLGLFWDTTSSRMYGTYGYGYTTDCRDWSIYRMEIDYNGATATASGPWGFTGIDQKASYSYIFELPSDLRPSSRRLAAGAASGFSQAASCDASSGFALTAFDPPSEGATEQVDLSNTKLMDFYPFGTVRQTKPAFIHATRSDAILEAGAGSTTQYQLTDTSYLVYVEGATKRAFVGIESQGQGQCNYVTSDIVCEYYAMFASIYDPADIAAVIAGTKQPHEVTATARFDITSLLSFIDRTRAPWNDDNGQVAISSISATKGAAVSGTSNLPLVTTSSAHGLSAGQGVSIRGTSDDAEYAANWTAQAIVSSTEFRINNTSLSSTWSGASATGGNIRTVSNGISNIGQFYVSGVSYDFTGDKLYIATSQCAGISSCANGAYLMVGAISIP